MSPAPAARTPDAGAFSALQPLDRDRSRAIARAFAPRNLFGNRHDFFYTLLKLRSDPLYPGVLAALRGTRAPVLDLGCGLGLLAHALRQDGQRQSYRGVDIDAAKIARGSRVAADCGLRDVRLEVMDVGVETPDHSGSVTILDVLQFLRPDEQHDLLVKVAGMIAPRGRLVIRTGLRDVIDFEIGLDVVSLGMIRDISLEGDRVTITMILTSPMCPMASFIMSQVKDRASELTDKPVEVILGRELWKPDMMEAEAREALGI